MEAGPATLIGSFLRASVFNDKKTRDALRAELIATEWHDAGGVIDAAFLEALYLRLGSTPKLDEVRKFSLRLLRIYKPARKELSPYVVERVLREGLGEAISVEGIEGKLVVAIQMFTLGAAVADLKLSELDVNALLERAERRAYSAGYRPTTVGAV